MLLDHGIIVGYFSIRNVYARTCYTNNLKPKQSYRPAYPRRQRIWYWKLTYLLTVMRESSTFRTSSFSLSRQRTIPDCPLSLTPSINLNLAFQNLINFFLLRSLQGASIKTIP